MKYTSVLDKFAEDYDIYHGVLTSPNVLGPELRGAGGKYAKCFQKLLRYFDGRAKIKDLDLSVYGYAGALRALEIVPNIDRSGMRRLPSGRYVYFDGVRADYHIHYHVMLLLKPNLHLKHYIYNDFSESKKQDNQQFEDHSKLYYFSELEILIQNIWYLLINDQKVTKAAIDALPLGYSCRCSLISDGGYHQVFKYITKTQDAGTVIPLEVFETLETATRGKRALQGFGKFHGLGLEDDKLIEDCDPAFDKLLMLLNSLSGYEQISETPTEIRDNITGQKSFYISRKKYRGYFLDKEDFNEVDLSELLAPLPPELRETLLKVVEQLPAVLEQMPSEPKPTFKQLSFNLPESLKADTFNTSYLDGGRNIKPSKKGRKNG